MAEPRVIPGFYFDAEKGKYFKISKTHSAPPSQAKYTLQNVRREQKKAIAEKNVKIQQEKRERETIVRPHTRNKWGLQMASLDREIGGRRKTYYTHGIWPDATVAGMDKMKTVCIAYRIAFFSASNTAFIVFFANLSVSRLSNSQHMASSASSIAIRILRLSMRFTGIMLSGDAHGIHPAAYRSHRSISMKIWQVFLYQTAGLLVLRSLKA
jgi:hypothetical protein